MKIAHQGKKLSNETKLKLVEINPDSQSTIIKDNKTGEILLFPSIRKAAEHVGIHHSYLAKQIIKNKFYLGNGFTVHNSTVNHDEIINSELYKKALNVQLSNYKHLEESRERIRLANIGRKLSDITKQKLSTNSSNAKPVLVTNNDTKYTLEFPSVTLAAKHLDVDVSFLSKYIKIGKSYKGHTIVRKSD